MFAAMMPGLAKNDILQAYEGLAVVLVIAIPVLTIVTTPLQAGIFRAVWGHLDRGEELSFGATFSAATSDLGGTYALALLTFVLTFVGLLCFYLPGLLAGLAVDFALPALVVHQLSAVESIKRSALHVRDHFVWHLGFWAIGFLILMVASQVPIVGTAVGIPLYAAYKLRGYRVLWPNDGSGASPDA